MPFSNCLTYFAQFFYLTIFFKLFLENLGEAGCSTMHGPLPHVVDASLPLCALPAFSLNIICPSCICQHFVFPDVHFVIEQTTELKTRSAMSAFSEWWRHRSWKYACDCLQVDIGAWLALLLSSYTLVLVFFLLAEKLTVTTKLVTIHAHIFRVPSL